MKRKKPLVCAVLFFFCLSGAAAAAEGAVPLEEEGDAELAQELTNPLADPMSIPIQMNYDGDSDRPEIHPTNWKRKGLK